MNAALAADITAISSYAAVGIQLLQASKPEQAKGLFERLAEQAARTMEVIRN
jgi:hypothetical protein